MDAPHALAAALVIWRALSPAIRLCGLVAVALACLAIAAL
jgi:hypothetical protein